MKEKTSPKKSPKTAMFMSALVFPGAGHVYLGYNKLGVPTVLLSMVTMVIFVHRIFMLTLGVISQLRNGLMVTKTTGIFDLYWQLHQQDYHPIYGISFWLFVFLWVLGMAHSYLLAVKMQKQ